MERSPYESDFVDTLIGPQQSTAKIVKYDGKTENPIKLQLRWEISTAVEITIVHDNTSFE